MEIYCSSEYFSLDLNKILAAKGLGFFQIFCGVLNLICSSRSCGLELLKCLNPFTLLLITVSDEVK